MEAAEGGELFGNAGGEGRCCAVFDVAQEVLDADFFGFFGLYCRGDMEESFAGFGAVLTDKDITY